MADVAVAFELGASWVALLGTIGGLSAGLAAPLVSQRANDRTSRRAAQADLAREALVLFDGVDSLAGLLGGEMSVTRRRLFLLANQLRDDSARKACMSLVAVAGTPPVDLAALDAEWIACVEALGVVVRAG